MKALVVKVALGGLLGMVLMPLQVLAWSAAGHRQIVDQAFARLPVAQRQVLASQLAQSPIVGGKRQRWKTDSKLRYLAVWPDGVRDTTVQGLFESFGSGRVPAALAGYAAGGTGAWHYTNMHYLPPPDSSGARMATAVADCKLVPQGELLPVFPQLLQAYRAAQDPRDQAVLLAFLVHLAADAFQPLHLMARLDSECRHDRGGNGYCLDPVPQAGRCQNTLHRLWDEGFGVFDRPRQKTWQSRSRPPPESAAAPPELQNLAGLGAAREGLSELSGWLYPELPLQPDYLDRAGATTVERAREATDFLYGLLIWATGPTPQ